MPASAATFTLVLTKGVHLVSSATADAIAHAVESDARTVLVALDPLGNIAKERRTLLAVRHVVAITENDPRAADVLPQNVATLPARQASLKKPRHAQ